jgi:hypothetical protein
VYRHRSHQQQDSQQEVATKARAPATDGFLAKFSSVAGAPAESDISDKQQGLANCWQNCLTVDPTKPFHYRVSTGINTALLNFTYVRALDSSSTPHATLYKAIYTYVCEYLYMHV